MGGENFLNQIKSHLLELGISEEHLALRFDKILSGCDLKKLNEESVRLILAEHMQDILLDFYETNKKGSL